MSDLIEGIDQRTRLVGRNRMELLLFRIGGEQTFGINVFKVREVIAQPRLRQLPGSAPIVRGVANIRGHTMAVIDLARAIGFPPPSLDANRDSKVIVTEFNRSVQGFWVSAVDRIVNVNWDAVKPPPRGTGRDSYLVAVTEVDQRWVEIVDVERVFAQINPLRDQIATELEGQASGHQGARRVLVVDDSMVARKQIERSVIALGLEVETRADGREALEYLQEVAAAGPVTETLSLVISDIEMPRMDGYTLTRKIRDDDKLRALHVLLHSSLSGQFNADLVKQAGADAFLPKFDPDELARAVLSYMHRN